MMIKKFNEYITESIKDKMKGISDEEFNKKLQNVINELINIGMTEGYTQDESIVRNFFFDYKWEEIKEYVLDGWSVDDIYSELQMDLEYYIEDGEID